MSTLFDSLRTAARSLDAHRLGMDVAGQNLANINTVGYTRRTILLAEVQARDTLSAGGGVEVLGVRAHRDVLIDARIRREYDAVSFDESVVRGLTTVEAAVGAPGAGLDAKLTAFFDAMSSFSEDVRSIPLRENVVRQGRALAQGFRSMAGALNNGRREADRTIRADVGELNALAAEVARLNRAIAVSAAGVETLIDERSVALEKLAQIGGVSVQSRSDGGVDVTIGQGRALVMGGDAYQVTMTDGVGGYAELHVGDVNVTTEVAGGEIGAGLHVRDTLLPEHLARLDQLAYDVATAVNGVHTAGYDLQGNPAGDFFVQPAVVAGAAAALTVDSALDADATLLAGSSTGDVGDNQTARALAALRDERFASGGTATAAQAWGAFVFHVGADISQAMASADSHHDIRRQLERLRDDASGVSIDEEAANLMRFQRAYEANARFFTTISDTIDTLMQMVR